MTTMWHGNEFEQSWRRERLGRLAGPRPAGPTAHESVRLRVGMVLIRLGLALAGPISPRRDVLVMTR
jgi:hypothetical protein